MGTSVNPVSERHPTSGGMQSTHDGSSVRRVAGRRAALALAIALAAPALGARPAAAQDWRSVSTMRRAAGEGALQVDLEYGAGTLKVSPGEGDLLYKAGMRYNADSFRPVTEYSDGRLRIGLDGKHGGVNIKNHESGHLDLNLGRSVPLDLNLRFGAVEATLELGGLRVRTAHISTGASETKLTFSEPNAVDMDRLELEIGAADFEARGLGNARVRNLDVRGGVADVTLDFSGAWQEDMSAEIQMGLGSITLRIPRSVGVHVKKKGFLASFDDEGFTKRGGEYFSENWSDAKQHLNLDVDSAFGSIDVVWISG